MCMKNRVKYNKFVMNRSMLLICQKMEAMTDIVLVVLLVIFAPASCSAPAEYIAPPDCQWTTYRHHQLEASVLLTCHVEAVGTGRANFSLIQSMHTIGLTIICDDPFSKSRLFDSSLSHLIHLQSLKFQGCVFPEIPNDAFLGLTMLKNLTINPGSQEDSRSSMVLTSKALSRVRELERFDLSNNNIMILPEYPFCGLITLKLLNLSGNAIQDVKLLGLEERKLFPCIPELQILDLSRNKIKQLTDEVLSSLRRLKKLDLSQNQLNQLSPYSLIGLQRLEIVNLSNNKLNEFHPHFFHHSTELKEIYLRNNSIAGFPSALLRSLSHLTILDLALNDIQDLRFLADAFKNPNKLSILDLSYNKIRRIEGKPFQALTSLQTLLLNDNVIEYISEKAFFYMIELKSLILSNNRLRIIESGTLEGLNGIRELYIDGNVIEYIHPDAFLNCTYLRYLDIKNNSLTYFPIAINRLEYLRRLNLAFNSIANVTNDTFENLKHIVSLDLSFNLIGNLSRGTFRDQYFLNILNLSNNKIQSLEHGIFDDAIEIEWIDLNDNLLSDINGLFMNLRNLRHLNVSRNNITWFDYALIPTGLVHLDMHDNRVDTLGNYFELESDLSLRFLDVSFNIIKEINPASFPNQLENAFMRNNSLKIINSFTFMSKTNLTFVDLRFNEIRNLDINALRLRGVPLDKELPLFYLSQNPLFCDCTMEWLQRINQLDDMRQYPKIVDLEELMCHMTFPRQQAIIPILKVKSHEFLCRYRSHCFALCHCCEFDACDCEMVCPQNCTCYSDQTWNTNIVDCSSRRYTRVPPRVPMDVTDLYLDGNDMSHVGSHSFIGRKNMRVLHLNSSNIHIIPNRTFNGLQNLLKLHLEHNYIATIQGHEFTNLTNLRELYLSYNRLLSINNSSFAHMKHLKILHVDHNYLAEFQVWNFNHNKGLINLRLGHNSWTCSCEYLGRFRDWLSMVGEVVIDKEDVRCYKNQSAGLYVLEFNSTACFNHSLPTYFKAELSRQYVPVMILAPSLLIFLVFILILVCVYNREMKIWLYSRYGVRLFQRNDFSGDTEKLFDAFLSYCKKDEAFVSQMLAPELENGVCPYRLCLRYRDLPTAEYVAEAIAEAVECSRCTLAVVSEQYLKSEWCLYELKAAHHEVRCNNRRHKVVVVLLDKISFKDLDTDVRLCLRSASIVNWGDRRFWEKLRFALPEARIHHKDNVSCKDFKTSTLRRSSISNSVKLV